MTYRHLVFLLGFIFGIGCATSRAEAPVNFVKDGEMEAGNPKINGWGGVDGAGFLQTSRGDAMVVTQFGKIANTKYPNSPCAGDLNGDRIPDLMVSDAAGLTWFYPNSGTAKEPKFTRGEVVPVFYVADTENYNPCLKMTLADFNQDGLLDMVVGDYIGHLYLTLNQGRSNTPAFRTPAEVVDMMIVPNNPQERRWGNYLSPFVFDWNGDGLNDLVIGDGTYSCNNVYLLKNTGSNQTPRFLDKNRQILFRGMGKEHLCPIVVDFNNDGKPDVITGEREGYVSLYVNDTVKSPEWKFKEPVRIVLGSTETVGQLSCCFPCDLNGDGLTDLLFGQASGHIGIAYNRGTKESPKFDPITDLKGVNPFTNYLEPNGWNLGAPPWSIFHVLRLVSSDSKDPLTYEEGYTSPPDTKGKRALEFEIMDPKQTTFPELHAYPRGCYYYLKHNERVEGLKPDTNYRLSFWMKGHGFEKTSILFRGTDALANGKGTAGVSMICGLGPSDSWSHFSQTITYRRDPNSAEKGKPASFELSFEMAGSGVFYVDDLEVVEDK